MLEVLARWTSWRHQRFIEITEGTEPRLPACLVVQAQLHMLMLYILVQWCYYNTWTESNFAVVSLNMPYKLWTATASTRRNDQIKFLKSLELLLKLPFAASCRCGGYQHHQWSVWRVSAWMPQCICNLSVLPLQWQTLFAEATTHKYTTTSATTCHQTQTHNLNKNLTYHLIRASGLQEKLGNTYLISELISDKFSHQSNCRCLLFTHTALHQPQVGISAQHHSRSNVHHNNVITEICRSKQLLMYHS